MEFKTGDGCRIAYDIEGDGPPLVLIHGWTLDRRMWAGQVPDLSRHFTVICYDRRGCGGSDGPPDLRRELDDLDELLAHLSIGKTCLLGVSQGGRVALRYTLTRPDKVRALILQGAPLDGFVPQANEDERIPLAHYAALIKAGRLDQFRRAWMDHPLMRIPAASTSLNKQITAMLNDYAARDLAGDITEQYKFPIDVAGNLESINTPTLILEGAEEAAWLKEVGDKLVNGIPNASRITVAGGGHLISMSAPEAFNRNVIEFLQRVI